MKKIVVLFVLLISIKSSAQQLMNAVIGDAGWKTILKNNPAAGETEKIQAHLFYVETYLRKNTPEELTALQMKNRLILLDVLRDYRLAGQFPVNEDFPGERRPHFIDSRGRICAVGYLVEQSAGRAEAERINTKYSYQTIAAMQDAGLENWMKQNGFTSLECAMIQPTYYFSNGATLKNQAIDSLPEIVSREIKYDGKADSAFISFVIKKDGKFTEAKVDSGNYRLGKAALAVLKKQKYEGAWSHGMGGSPNYRDEKVKLTVYYGITGLGNVNISYRQKNSTEKDEIVIAGQVLDARTGETLIGTTVIFYNDSGKVIGGAMTDADGRYSFRLKKKQTGNLRIEYKYPSYATSIAKQVPYYDCEIIVRLTEAGDGSCNSLNCLQRIYIERK